MSEGPAQHPERIAGGFGEKASEAVGEFLGGDILPEDAVPVLGEIRGLFYSFLSVPLFSSE